jgi:DNA-binding response OmpR family regulator
VSVRSFIRRVPTDKSSFPVFATKGSGLEKTRFGGGASLLGSLDAAVNTDVIVLDWALPKMSGIDL